MRLAFTLIELLVVIAIISILAAILFPVFAQAKSAAKKAVGISNQMQIGLGFTMYCADFDDKYPQTDGCDLYSSLNPKFRAAPYNAGPGDGCSGGQYWNRVNSYSWPKWIMPYARSVALFAHPGRQRDATMWDTQGEIMNGFAFNPALTGGANVDVDTGRILRVRNSWLGGTQSGIPDVSSALLLFEFGSSQFNFSPMVMTQADYNLPVPAVQTVYPQAYREYWARIFMKWTQCTGPNLDEISDQVDSRAVFAGVIIVGRADGSARAYPVAKFLANCPTIAEYGPMDDYGDCGAGSEVMRIANAPNLDVDYPMWGLTR